MSWTGKLCAHLRSRLSKNLAQLLPAREPVSRRHHEIEPDAVQIKPWHR